MATSNFYERQLVLLIVVCVVVLLLERWVSSRDKKPHDSSSVEGVDDSLEDEDTKSVSSTPAGALSTLMRKYLTVYAIVMGTSPIGLSLY